MRLTLCLFTSNISYSLISNESIIFLNIKPNIDRMKKITFQLRNFSDTTYQYVIADIFTFFIDKRVLSTRKLILQQEK